ncbi:2OG-Fe dioxygenase family protein [Streptomyces sp. NPDC057877]|uniref:2OG-Fe dioxygenase family protein n=1 Tax=Streptomyces sp. NPDC057877 TaxID=3346269 RepID=UPI0036CBCEDA
MGAVRPALGGAGTDGEPLKEATLSEPGAPLLGDDRRTVHGVSPVHPLDGDGAAWRDVLVAAPIPAGS